MSEEAGLRVGSPSSPSQALSRPPSAGGRSHGGSRPPSAAGKRDGSKQSTDPSRFNSEGAEPTPSSPSGKPPSPSGKKSLKDAARMSKIAEGRGEVRMSKVAKQAVAFSSGNTLDKPACSCGNKLLDDSNFCRKCGRRRSAKEAQQQLPTQRCICGNTFAEDAVFCRKCGAKRVEGQSSGSSPKKEDYVSLEGAAKIFSEHTFFAGLRSAVIDAFARVATRRQFTGDPLGWDADMLVEENTVDFKNDYLWVLEKGEVQVEEQGELLGILKEGSVFGDAVAFGRAEQQPFTIRLCEGAPMICWCVPNAAVSFVLRQYTTVREPLELRMDEQVRRLLMGRVSKLIFFSHVSPHFLRSLQKLMEVVHYKKDAELFKCGAAATSMVVVVRGSVKLIMSRLENRRGTPKPNSHLMTQRHMSRLPEAQDSLKRGSRPGTSSNASDSDSSGEDDDPPEDRKSVLGGDLTTRGSELTRLALPEMQVNDLECNATGGDADLKAVKQMSFSLPTLEEGPNRRKSVAAPMTLLNIQSVVTEEPSQASNLQFDAVGAKSDSDESSSAEDESSVSDMADISGASAEEEGECWSDDSEATSEGSDAAIPMEYPLPENRACLEPEMNSSEASAGPEAMVFGDAVLLNFQHTRPRQAIATQDCIAFVLSMENFQATLKRHPRESKHYDQIAAVEFQEWQRCGLTRLSCINIFNKSSPKFLTALAEVVEPKLFFAGEDMTKCLTPKGLLCLMSGHAEQVNTDGSTKKVHGPQSFGSLEWLGAKDTQPLDKLRARELCQALFLCHSAILTCLKLYPNESTQMVAQVLRQNGESTSGPNKMSIGQSLHRGTVMHASMAERRRSSGHGGLQLNMWHIPFCNGLDQGFTEEFTMQLELNKIVPGQQLFRGGSDPDFMVLLVKGSLEVKGANGPATEVTAPLLVCGYDRNRILQTHAIGVCEVHHLTCASLQKIAEEYPQDTRQLLERLMAFQARSEDKLNYPWWSPFAALQSLPAFCGSNLAFLHSVARHLTMEIYTPGDVIVKEGDRVDSTMILECGQAVVEKIDTKVSLWVSDRVAEIQDGFWIGGVGGICGFAGELRRNATIRASSVCKVHRLMNSVFVEILGSCPEERQRFRELAERQLQIRDTERLEDHAFFKDFDKAFLNLLRPKCRPQVFFSEEVLMVQGAPADSLFILGADSIVTIEVDGLIVRELTGRACLGVVALLSPRPVKRASTIMTRAACSVRTITRVQWLEALSHHPEHRRWLQSFTSQQMSMVAQARGDLMTRRAWDKIQKREGVASRRHQERYASCFIDYGADEFAPLPPQPRRRVANSATPRGVKDVNSQDKRLEYWDCYNGAKAAMPHIKLPQLGAPPRSSSAPYASQAGTAPSEMYESQMESADEAGDVEFMPRTIDEKRRRSAEVWLACEKALGVQIGAT